MLTCYAFAIPLTMLASIEGPTQDAISRYYSVSAVVGSMTTVKTPSTIDKHESQMTISGIFLVGIRVGSLFSDPFSDPFSETFGRNSIYISKHGCGPAFHHGQVSCG